MTRSSLVLLAAGIAMIAVYLFAYVDVGTDGRKLGRIDDIPRLAERDDLNVLFILVDTLRADRLGTYGYERDTSPVIDAMAADGIRFGDHRSQSSWTKTSMASLWTGLHPVRTQILRFQHALPAETRMPAEIFRDGGYRTFGIWRNGWVAPNFGFDQGFEVYHNPRVSKLPPEVRQENPTLATTASDFDILDSTLTFLSSYQNERWFLYLHMMDLHQYTYDEKSALFGATYSDTYDNSIRHTDRLIGAILNELVDLDLRGRTLVVLASDHGEAFGEHGHEGHAKDLYFETTKTPWILSLPFRLEGGLVVDAASENVDVWPTLLALVGLPELPDADGRTRIPEILAAGGVDPGPVTARPRYAQLDMTWGRTGEDSKPTLSVTDGRFRMIQVLGDPEKTEVFDLANDPAEQTNLLGEDAEVDERLDKLIAEHLESDPPPWQPKNVELDDMNLRQLRALGYVIE